MAGRSRGFRRRWLNRATLSSMVASRVKGAKEMQVAAERSFDVDKLDIWIWAAYTETYSNTITYTFDCTAWN